QDFPATAPTEALSKPPKSKDDRNFALHGVLAGDWIAEPVDARRRRGFQRSDAAQPLRLDITLFTPRDASDTVAHARDEATRLASIPVAELHRKSAADWAAFRSASAVELVDQELEAMWYRNQYFLACCVKPGKVAPGLFGNWSSGKIGTAWHGDYHMNYNTEQVWWGVFSSNHAEQHLPYVELCEKLTVLGEAYAKDKFGLPGAACRFLAAYVQQGGDGRYHIIPTVSPENWGFTVDMRLNKDCIIDLALSQFVLKATAEAARILGVDADESARWREIG